MAEITLDGWDIALDVTVRRKTLRKLAAKVAPLVTAWYNEKWSLSANIVAVDFIQATGIVEVAIVWNDRRTSPCFSHAK